MRKLIISIAILLLLSGSTSQLFAQSGGQRQGGGGGERGGGQSGQGMRPEPGNENRPGMQRGIEMNDLKRLERLRMMKLLDLLDLDTGTESIVIPQIRKHQTEMFQLMKKYQNKIDKLADGLKNNKFSDEEIIDQIRELDQIETDKNEKIKAFQIEVSKILTPDQLGKLYVFQARFGGEVLEKMGQFRKAQDEFRDRIDGN